MSSLEKLDNKVQNEDKIRNLVEQIVESVSSVTYPNESDQLKEKYTKLKTVHELQKSIVRQNIHNAMSPLSAISGYLELINMSLMNDPDLEQLEFYRQKIEKGITEVNTIIEQLQGIYTDETDTTTQDVDSMLVVDLNWLVRDVCSKMHFTEQDIQFDMKSAALHVQTDIFITKLIIFNLINYASKCNTNKSSIEISTEKYIDQAYFTVVFDAAKSKKLEIGRVIKSAYGYINTYVSNNSFDEGLITSVKLALEIGSKINYMSSNSGLAQLNFTIPLAKI